MKPRFSFPQTALCAFSFVTLSLAACGGRFETIHRIDDAAGSGGSAPSAGRGGSVSSRAGSGTGATGIGGSSSAAGSGSAGSSSAGSSSAGSGGAGDCLFIKCAVPLTCLGGQQPLTEPGECCPSKCSECPPCPMLACPEGYQLETAESDCCPHCAPSLGLRCLQGKQKYAAQRAVMVDKYSYGCASDSECVLVAPVNACELGCSYASIWYGISDSFESNLKNLASMSCWDCSAEPTPPCDAAAPPRCVDSRCTQ